MKPRVEHIYIEARRTKSNNTAEKSILKKSEIAKLGCEMLYNATKT